MEKQLIILTGPTGIGKTDTSIELAQRYGTEIISCDSRQFYRELSIGTAVPSAEQLSAVKHHLIGNISIADYYNVYLFERDALAILNQLFTNHDIVFMVGGSGMYIDVMEKGIDDIPDIDQVIRDEVGAFYEREGLQGLWRELKLHDPKYLETADLKNYRRLIRAVEVCRQTGKPYSAHRIKKSADRPFNIKTICFERDRAQLYDRINKRVDIMMEQGLRAEAEQFYSKRDLNALNTVGYKELFAFMDGEYDLDKAVELIKRNTRHYAKKQMSWFRRNPSVHYLHPDDMEAAVRYIES